MGFSDMFNRFGRKKPVAKRPDPPTGLGRSYRTGFYKVSNGVTVNSISDDPLINLIVTEAILDSGSPDPINSSYDSGSYSQSSDYSSSSYDSGSSSYDATSSYDAGSSFDSSSSSW